jgi:DNA-damage-inducible protein J
MAAVDVVRARLDSDLKRDASAVLGAMGLTVSDAIRLLFVRVVAEKALPFDIRIPNAETEKAMAEADKGKVESFASVEALMADLND